MLTHSSGAKLVFRQKPLAAILLAVASSVLMFSPKASAVGLAQNFSFDGILLNDSTGVPLTGPVALRFQIYDPTGVCLLFEEEHAAVALQADGSFNVKVGSGSRASAGVDGGLAMKQVFQNLQTVRAAASPGCTPGFTPAAGDARRLRVTVNANALTPDYTLSPMPMATVAETLQGRGVEDFVSTTAASSLVGPMTLATQGEVRFGSATANYVSLRAPFTVPAPVNFYLPATDGSAGQCLTTNGSGQFVWAACGGALAPTGVTPASYAKVTVNSEGRVTAGLALTNADLAPIAFMGDVSGTVSTLMVDRIKGHNVSGTAPTSGQVLRYNVGLTQWEPSTMADFTVGGTMGGPLTVTAGGVNVSGGSLMVPMGSAATPSLQVGSSTYGLFNAAGSLAFSATGAERMRITSGGNIGIGTTAPIELLDVNGNIHVAGDTIVTGSVLNTAMSSPSTPGIALYDNMSGVFHNGTRIGLSTGGIERLSINTTTGKVGIGTSTPMATLDVMGTAKLQKNATAPVTCTAGADAMIAMTSTYTLCVCNSTSWVRASDGTTACTW